MVYSRRKTMRASFAVPQGKPLWRYFPHVASLAVVDSSISPLALAPIMQALLGAAPQGRTIAARRS